MLHLDAAFSGKSILITGTTGFVGKAILERLLHEFDEIKQVYLLIRGNKKCPDAESRFWEEIYTSSVFHSLKESDEQGFKQQLQEKCRFVTAEMTQPRFGLSSEDYKSLAAEVDVIINSAASVNFREPLDDALAINTLSLLSLVDLADRAGNIPFIHISTCYVNGYHRGSMPEQNVVPQGEAIEQDEAGFYQIERLIDHLLNKVNQIKADHAPEQHYEELVELGIKTANRYGWNDTYTFTKWLGEQLLQKHLQGKPLTIVRPAIVESALQSPAPGWIEGVKVADAIILAYARRRFTFFPARTSGVVDIIPVDFVVNGTILATAECLQSEPEHRIYQCCSSEQNPLTIAQYMDYVIEDLREKWRDYPKLTKNKAPGKTLKAVSRSAFLAGIKSMQSLAKVKANFSRQDAEISHQTRSIEVTLNLATTFSFYTNPRYTFSNQNLLELGKQYTGHDLERFPVDTSLINWQEYLSDIHLPGLEKYGMK